MPVEVAAHAGFCMGVSRAVEKAEAMARDGIPSCTLGELIHNPEVIRRLAERGLEPIRKPEEASGRRVLIRSHGVSPQVLEQLKASGDQVLDLTCPFVDKLHRIVEEDSAKGYEIVIVGSPDHPEVRGIMGWSSVPVTVIENAEQAESFRASGLTGDDTDGERKKSKLHFSHSRAV